MRTFDFLVRILLKYYMELFWIILGAALIVVAFIGCIVPGLPGSGLAYGATLLLHFTQLHYGKPAPYSVVLLIILAILVVAAEAGDYLIPVAMGKRYGISKQGTIGSVIGLIAGLILFPPIGIIIGVFAGAFIGESIAGKEDSEALKAGFGSFLGTMVSMASKLTLTAVMGFFYVVKMIQSIKGL